MDLQAGFSASTGGCPVLGGNRAHRLVFIWYIRQFFGQGQRRLPIGQIGEQPIIIPKGTGRYNLHDKVRGELDPGGTAAMDNQSVGLTVDP